MFNNMQIYKMYRLFSIVLFSFLSIISLNAQVSIDTKANKQTAMIGDRIDIEFIVKTNKNLKIVFPEIKDTINNLRVIGREPIDTISKDNYRILSQKIYVTAFDSGNYVFPSLTFFYSKSNSMMIPAYSKQLSLRVNLPDVSGMKDIKEIKLIYDIKTGISDYILEIVLGGILFIVIIIIVFILMKRKKPKNVLETKIVPIIPPIITLRQELNEIKSSDLCSQGAYKVYFSKLSDALRLYLEMKFNFPALESTSFDLLKYINKSLTDTDFKDLAFILNTSDSVKFAKHIPTNDEISISLELAYKLADSIEKYSSNRG